MKPTVAIIGVGLIGGSLGMALRKSGRYRVLGVGRDDRRLNQAKRLGAVDAITKRFSDVITADIVVIGSPVNTIAPIFERILPFLKPGTIVTDVGSVKGSVLKKIAHLPKPASISFVGGHPLAGSHKTGVEAANSRLFAGSTVVLTPAPEKALRPLKALWRAAGAKVRVMSAESHDQAVALISHLPHLIAHALVHSLAGHSRRREMLPLLAGSFRDATRVASADADQWAQILGSNARAVIGALTVFRRQLTSLEHLLPRRRLLATLRRSQNFRRPLFNGK